MVRSSLRSLVVLGALALAGATTSTAAADVPVAGNAWAWPTLKSWLEGAPDYADVYDQQWPGGDVKALGQ